MSTSKVWTLRTNGSRSDIVGMSGGTDSSYLLHLCKKYNLKALAVNLDNGWNSETAVSNIRKMTTALDIDLETYIIDYITDNLEIL